MGSVEPLKKLFSIWQDQVQFIEVIVRQEHPGPGVRPYSTVDHKLSDAKTYAAEQRIPWTVAIDDLAGATHAKYGGLADPTYIVDRDGNVAFYNMWTHAPTLHRALKQLSRQNGRGVVLGAIDQRVHVAAAMTDGWKALCRGLPQSFFDMELASPGSGTMLWLGHQLRPILKPLTLRAKPLPMLARAALAIGAVAAVAGGVYALKSHKPSGESAEWQTRAA